jgi:serpin B
MKTLFAVFLVLPLMTILAFGTAEEETVKALAEGNNTFAISLYKKLSNEKGNMFFSPYSISSALAMVYAGARGNTEAEMAKALNFQLAPKQLHQAFGEICRKTFFPKKKQYELSIANALWKQAGYKFNGQFLDIMKDHYAAGFYEVDFKKQPEKAAAMINTWTSKKTNGKIKKIISQEEIVSRQKFIITSAIYFKGYWKQEFDKLLTENMPFTMPNGDKIDIPMMNNTDYFGYNEEKNLQILEMDYLGDNLSMIILLPIEKDGISLIEKEITAEKLKNWRDKIDERRVAVTMPRFKIGYSLDLAQSLETLGMKEAFSQTDADFSGLSDSGKLYINMVMHFAYIDVDEKGTEAAAVTITGGATPVGIFQIPEPIVFKADHPFLFLIRDKSNGSILFIGRVMDPRSRN